MSVSKLHEKLYLFVDENSITLIPEESDNVLVLDRTTFKLELQGSASLNENLAQKSQEIYGCLGIIDLFSGPYIIVVSQREEVGTISEMSIFEVTKASIIQVAKNNNGLTEDEKRLEKEYISLLTDFMEDCAFYFSYEYDITHTAQRISQMTAEDKAKPLWERVDERFFWNKHIQSRFIAQKLNQYILPVVDGFIKMASQVTHESEWKYIFISRRGCLRTGARYHTRGADPLGNVANFVETEQIVEYTSILSSFVQVRGSIPFFWQQKGKGLKPKPVVDISSSAELAFRRHMEGLIDKYGPVVVVSLIDQRGNEVHVGESFETHMYILNNPKLKYVAFDFHEKCKNNKYENLSLLVDQISADMTNYSYFLRDEAGKPVMRQSGIVRTNCIDCLDRTNVVQSVLARQVLLVQLNHLGILGSNEKIEQHPVVETMFKNVWADNADTMSEQYTGTGALKTDYTRTGKRSVKGSVMDGVNSAKRYINKSFKDDEKQEVIDLFLGHFVVEKWHYDVIEEGTYRFIDMSMINEWTSKGMSAVMQVNLNTRVMTWYLLERGQRTDIPFDSLIQIEKAAKDYKMLRIHHSGSPHPVRFQFPTASIREQFTQLLYFSHPSLNPVCSVPRDPQKPFLKLRIFIGTWNMRSTAPSSEDLPVWIPKDKDFYAIGTQFLKLMPKWKLDPNSMLAELGKSRAGLLKTVRRKSKILKNYNSKSNNKNNNYNHEEHDVPEMYSMPCKEYWHLMIRQYLGSEYIALATINTEETSLIVLVRQSMCPMVNNLEVTPVKIRQKTTGEEKKGGLAKLKKATENLKDQMKTAKEKNDVFGCASMFRFLDTSFCMINYSMDNGSTPAPNPLLATVDTDEAVMHLKGDYDLHNDFHHVFWFGNLPNHSSSHYWVSLYSHEENTGGNAVLWRALHDAPMLSEIEVGNTPTTGTNAPNPPAFAQAAVGVFIPPLPQHPLLSRHHYCTISLSQLVCTQSKPDLYLVCHAPFLLFPGRTGFLKKGDEGCWQEEITVRSFIIEREHIDMLHLRVELWERVLIGDEDKIAAGVMSLKSSGDVQPLPFTSKLWNNNEIVAIVSGEISVSFQQEIATEPDSVSADPNHPFSPPMSIPAITRSSSSDSPRSSSPSRNDSLSPSASSSATTSSASSPSGPSPSPSPAPASTAFGNFFKLPFPQISNLGTRDSSSNRLSFFGKALPVPMAGHREAGPQDAKDDASNDVSSPPLPSSSEDLFEIAQPLTSLPPSPARPSAPSSRPPSPSPSPSRSLRSSPSHSRPSSPSRSLLLSVSSSSISSSSSSPVPPAPSSSLPLVDLTDDPDIPPPIPPKPKNLTATDFAPIPSLSPSVPSSSSFSPSSDPVPIASPVPLSSPPSASASTDSPSSESESGAKNLISRIARFGISLVRSGSSDQLLPPSSSSSSSIVSPSAQRRSPTPSQLAAVSSPPPSTSSITSPPPSTSSITSPRSDLSATPPSSSSLSATPSAVPSSSPSSSALPSSPSPLLPNIPLSNDTNSSNNNIQTNINNDAEKNETNTKRNSVNEDDLC